MSNSDRSSETQVTRRQMLSFGAKASAAILLGGCASPMKNPLPTPPANKCQPGPFSITYNTNQDPAFRAMVSKLIDTPHDKIFELCTEYLKKETSDTLLAAILNADVEVLTPNSDGDLHAALSVHSARSLGMALPKEQRLIPVYYAANALKLRQERFQGGGLIGKAVAAKKMSESSARKSFDEAIVSSDAGASDAAMVQLFENLPHSAAVEHLLRWSSRDMGFVGHIVIWCGLGITSLDSLGWHFAQPVLRSVARDMVRYDDKVMHESHTRYSKELATLSSIKLDPCAADDGITRELLAEIRRGDTESAGQMVRKLLNTKVPTQSVWDGLALAGAENLLDGGRGIALHRFDAMNAFHHMYRRTNQPTTKALLLIQCAAWMAKRRVKYEEAPITKMESKPTKRLDDIFDAITDGPVPTAERVLGWLNGGGSQQALELRAQELAVQKAHRIDEHNYKFPVAVIEEAALASPQWKPYILAAIGGEESRCPSTKRGDWLYLQQAQEWIARL